jgi:hypothetical protein
MSIKIYKNARNEWPQMTIDYAVTVGQQLMDAPSTDAAGAALYSWPLGAGL